jgi:hypothetical protein
MSINFAQSLHYLPTVSLVLLICESQPHKLKSHVVSPCHHRNWKQKINGWNQQVLQMWFVILELS